MNRFEDRLRRALREPAPSSDLAARVVAGASRMQSAQTRFARLLRGAAAAALIVGVTVGALHYQRVREERIAGERARDELIQAFRLAGEQIKPFQKQLDEMRAMTIPIPKGEN